MVDGIIVVTMSHENGAKSTAVRKFREQERETQEPLNTVALVVQGPEDRLNASLTAYGRDTLDISKGDDIELQIYPNRLEIHPIQGSDTE